MQLRICVQATTCLNIQMLYPHWHADCSYKKAQSLNLDSEGILQQQQKKTQQESFVHSEEQTVLDVQCWQNCPPTCITSVELSFTVLHHCYFRKPFSFYGACFWAV